jgi:cell division transport system permease protein
VSEPGPYPFSVTRRASTARFFRQQTLTLKESFAYVSSHLTTSVLVWAVVAVALALPGAVYLVRVNLQAVSGDWQEPPAARVFLKSDAERAKAQDLVHALSSRPGVRGASLVSPDEALAELDEYSGLTEAFRGLSENPLPWAIVIELDGSADASTLLAELDSRPEVDQVLFEHDWAERLSVISKLVERTWWLLGGLLGLGVLLVAAVAVRLALEERLEEVLILKLVGASRLQVLTPFVYLGLWYGTVGGIGATLALGFSLMALDAPMARLAALYGQDLHIVGFDSRFALVTVAAGAGLGVAGALVASARRLRKVDLE